MSTLSNYANNQLLNVFENKSPVIPTQFYIAVMSTTSNASTPGTEITGNGYARVPITFERVSDIQRWNPADVTTPPANAEWTTVASFTIWDDANEGGGNYWGFGNVSTAFSVQAGDAIKWPTNKVIVGLGSAA